MFNFIVDKNDLSRYMLRRIKKIGRQMVDQIELYLLHCTGSGLYCCGLLKAYKYMFIYSISFFYFYYPHHVLLFIIEFLLLFINIELGMYSRHTKQQYILIFLYATLARIQISQAIEAEPKQMKIRNKQIKGIDLFHEIPERLIKNEIFRFHGEISDPRLKKQNKVNSLDMYINLTDKKNKTNYSWCKNTIIWANLSFDLSCRFYQPGMFSLTFVVIYSYNSKQGRI